MKKAFLFGLSLQVFLSCKKNNTDSQSFIPIPQEQPKPVSNAYYENFDKIDISKWEYQLYTFDGNGCNMRQENVTIHESIMSLKAEKNLDLSLPKKYNGGEIGDKRFYMYGYFSVRMRPIANERDDLALRDTLLKIKEFLEKNGCKCPRPTPPENEDLFGNYSFTRKKYFMDRLEAFVNSANQAIASQNQKESCIKWQKHLGDRFPCSLAKDEIDEANTYPSPAIIGDTAKSA